MRTYQQTTPWISFQWEHRKVPLAVWLLLGEASALSLRLKEAALPAEESTLMDYAALLRGALANATLDGNSLTEDQVDRLFEGSLHLPPSQQFLWSEVQNVVKAIRFTQERTRNGDGAMGPWVLQLLNAHLLKGLPIPGGAPGEYRTRRSERATMTMVAADDIGYLVDRLCTWIHGPLFLSEHEEEVVPYGILRALLAHLYLVWIQPFEEANGRTARLMEHQLLLQAGLPPVAAHRMAMHASVTRSEYQRQIAQASTAAGDPIPFVAYMVRGFVDGLRTLWAEVEATQHDALWNVHLGRLLAPNDPAIGARHVRLLQDLRAHHDPIPTGKVGQLSAELARYYTKLHPKTLQRDLNKLQEQGFVTRGPEGVRALPVSLKAFQR